MPRGDKPSIALQDLPPEALERLGIQKPAPKKAPRRKGIDRSAVRRNAIDVLAVISDLEPADRKRVLEHALRMNEL